MFCQFGFARRPRRSEDSRSGGVPCGTLTRHRPTGNEGIRVKTSWQPHVGTSGWQYNHWRGVFYPDGLKSEDRLKFYAQHLHTLELNVTFYRQVKPETFQKWYDTVPSQFLFSVKMSRFITHIKRLAIEEESMRRFLDSVDVLKEKLGVILIQLPPSLKFEHALMEDFFSLLDQSLKYTVEARSDTFVSDDFFSLLQRREIAWCIADSGGKYPFHEAITAPSSI